MSKTISIILIAICGLIVGFLIYFFYPSSEINGNKVNVYFSNSIEDPDMFDCGKVYPVKRIIEDVQNIPFLTLSELLVGPSKSEIGEGFSTNINSGVEIQELIIKDRKANVDFSSKLNENVAGSCLVSAIRAQITQTLLQFNDVDEVIISINGEIEEILQP